jgi:valyl-tRNA synthetase
MMTEQFFWQSFTDTYLELAKVRARGELGEDERMRGSAIATLRLGLNVLLRLFAPVLPYITEETWSWIFAEESGQPSIHAAPWPSPADFETVEPPSDAGSFDLAATALAVINRKKSEAGVSAGRVAEELVLAANDRTRARLEPVWADVAASARCQSHRLETKAKLDDGAFEVLSARFAEKQ